MPLKITIPDSELFDQKSGRFLTVKGRTLRFEHSLISISKWESKWHKSYFSKEPKSEEESVDYIRCMCLTDDVTPAVIRALDRKLLKQIADYIADPMTGTKLRKLNEKPSKELVTSELVYFWMTNFNIPFEPCEKWHFNRLMTLIEIASRKNTPPKKMGRREAAQQRAALNAQRRAKYNTRG